VLEAALAHDEPLAREHAAWALARIEATCRDGRGTGGRSEDGGGITDDAREDARGATSWR
jgi:hypothetical protein